MVENLARRVGRNVPLVFLVKALKRLAQLLHVSERMEHAAHHRKKTHELIRRVWHILIASACLFLRLRYAQTAQRRGYILLRHPPIRILIQRVKHALQLLDLNGRQI